MATSDFEDCDFSTVDMQRKSEAAVVQFFGLANADYPSAQT